MTQQIILLYELAQSSEQADFLAALELAAEQQMYGAEYVQAIISQPHRHAPGRSAELVLEMGVPQSPAQQEIERDLALYERYIANRESVFTDLMREQGGHS